MVEYIMSLKQVDEANIGITGHSWSNWGSLKAIDIELASSNNNIAAYVNQAMGLAARGVPFMGPGINEAMVYDGLFVALNLCKYDEFDALTGDTDALNNDVIKSKVAMFDPSFDLAGPIAEGTIYTAAGPIGVLEDNGQQAVSDTDRAIVVYNPPETHPSFHFSLLGTELVVEQFYAAFGVPDGASFIQSTNQIWPIVACFSF
jgi:hypothetical protein